METHSAELFALFLLVTVAVAVIDIALVPVVMGLVLCFLGVHAWVFMSVLGKRGIKGTGEIMSYQSDSHGNKTPVVRFITKSGRKIINTPYVSFSVSLNGFVVYRHRVDKSVAVLYHPDKPERFVLGGRSSFNYLAVILMVTGGLVLAGLGLSSFFGLIDFGSLG